MHTLPHTGIQVPNLDWKITSYRSLNTHDGVAYVATLRHLGKIVGAAENTGTGGGTWSQIGAREDRAAFAAYVGEAVDSVGKPASEEGVLEDLVSEYEWAKKIARANKRGGTVIRLMTSVFGDDGEPDMAPFAEMSSEWSARITPANWDKVVQTLAAETPPSGDRHGMGMERSFWQMWNGTEWENLTSV